MVYRVFVYKRDDFAVEAVELLKKVSYAKFDATVEVLLSYHIKTIVVMGYLADARFAHNYNCYNRYFDRGLF